MSFQDKSLVCSDCGASFTFTASEQEFYAGKGLTNEPKRCPTCRQARKAERGDRGGSGGGYGGSSFGNRAQRQMFPATCAQCGKSTEVPFEPRGDKPVYCSDCYSKMRPSR
jgi:CxxC-x17-CxxC domain-containing protein